MIGNELKIGAGEDLYKYDGVGFWAEFRPPLKGRFYMHGLPPTPEKLKQEFAFWTNPKTGEMEFELVPRGQGGLKGGPLG